MELYRTSFPLVCLTPHWILVFGGITFELRQDLLSQFISGYTICICSVYFNLTVFGGMVL